MTFCGMGRTAKCNPSMDSHTMACQRREVLGRRLVLYLRDEVEAGLRTSWTKELNRPLDTYDVLLLYQRWEIANSTRMDIPEAATNIIAHRMLPDVGEFAWVLKLAMEIIQEEALRHADQQILPG